MVTPGTVSRFAPRRQSVGNPATEVEITTHTTQATLVGLTVADLSVDGRSPVDEPTAEELGLAPDAEVPTDEDGGEVEAEAEGGECPSDPHRRRSPVPCLAEYSAASLAATRDRKLCTAKAVWRVWCMIS